MPRQKQSPTKEEKIKQRLSHVLFVYRPAFHVIAAGRDRPAALNIKESRNKSSIHACLQKCISFYKKEFQFQSRQQQQHRLLFSLFSSNGTATPALPITAADPSDRCVYWGIYGRRQWSVVQERSRDPIDGVRARGLLFFSFSFFLMNGLVGNFAPWRWRHLTLLWPPPDECESSAAALPPFIIITAKASLSSPAANPLPIFFFFFFPFGIFSIVATWSDPPQAIEFFFPSSFSEKTFHPAAGYILSSLLCGERNRRGSMCQRAYIDFNRTGVCWSAGWLPHFRICGAGVKDTCRLVFLFFPLTC